MPSESDQYGSVSINIDQCESISTKCRSAWITISMNMEQYGSIRINVDQQQSISIRLRARSRRHSLFLAKPGRLAVRVRCIGRVIANPTANKRPDNRSEQPRRQQGLGQAVPGDGAAEHAGLIAENVPVQLGFVVKNCRCRFHRSIHVLKYVVRHQGDVRATLSQFRLANIISHLPISSRKVSENVRVGYV